jgi:hypothetical protein
MRQIYDLAAVAKALSKGRITPGFFFSKGKLAVAAGDDTKGVLASDECVVNETKGLVEPGVFLSLLFFSEGLKVGLAY